jgi:cation diffusion facilitator CzcD-associated flavoprotein CzcO
MARALAADRIDERRDRFCIIGAGPAGLGTARALTKAGIAFDVIERQDGIGGIWNGESDRAPMYDSAHFISSKDLSAFSDFPMPSSYPDYPGWRLVLEYLHAFADAYDLRRHIELGREVRSVSPRGDGWRVELANGDARLYRGIVIAAGHQWHPRMPHYPGRFDGVALHSSRYKRPEIFRDARVLVVGGGNSGCDIACDAAQNARRAWISVRRGYHFLPKHLFGKPTDAFFRSGPELPTWLAQPLLGLLLRILVGDLTRLGLPRPDHKVLESHPIVNSQLLHHLAHGDVQAKPDVAELRGRRVLFKDGSEEEIDVIIWATGYELAFPFVEDSIIGRETPGRDLLANVVHRRAPGLYVVGLFETDGGAYPVISKQAELVARTITAREEAGEAARWLEDRLGGPAPDLSGGVHYVDSPRHRISVQFEANMHYLDRILRRLPSTPAAISSSTE